MPPLGSYRFLLRSSAAGRISTPIASINVRTSNGATNEGMESWRDVTVMMVPDRRESVSLAGGKTDGAPCHKAHW